MKKQYKIQLPKGKKVTMTNVDCEDGVMTVNVEIENRKVQKYEPKDGDFILLKWKCNAHLTPTWGKENNTIERYAIAIFKGVKNCGDINELFCYVIYSTNDGLNGKPLFIYDNMNGHGCSSGDVSMYDEIRPATEEEKKLLIDKLAEVCKRWNEETRTIEDARWRAGMNKPYYYIIGWDTIVGTTDERLLCDENRYYTNNYFKNRESAGKVAEQIREIFKNSKAE